MSSLDSDQNDKALNATEDRYEVYEEQFNPLRTDRHARRSRKPRVRHIPKKSSAQVIDEIAETTGLEGGFKTTYKPGLFEEGWLLAALQSFYDQALITDVLYRVKGGKEANVYCCAAHPSTGVNLLAAKVYRPRMFRNLRNDQAYREGRDVLTAGGRPVKTNDHRIMRAIGKKTAFGQQVAHTSWLMYEYTTLEKLFHAGAAVPKPFGVCENAVLMSFCGDERLGAPALNETAVEADEAEPLFQETLRNVEIMLKHDLIHGDLSAYNILYWEGEITLIDFPQVTNSRTNGQAHIILERDVRRVCEYFARYGVRADTAAISRALWDRYVNIQPVDRALDVLED